MCLSGLVRLLGLLGHLLSRIKARSLRFDRHRHGHGHRITVELRVLRLLWWLRILLLRLELVLWRRHKRHSRLSHYLAVVERHGARCIAWNKAARLLARDELRRCLLLGRVRRFKVRVASSMVHVLIIWLRLAELVIVSVILWPALRCTSRWVEDLGAGRHVKSRLLSWRLLNWLLRLGWSWGRRLEGGRRLEFLHRAHH